jgi:methyl-accepting chemotaxis protein
MDEMTQHNAALVEETNAAIEQTENQALELDSIVSTFSLGKGDAADEQKLVRSAGRATPDRGGRGRLAA